jgi:hypothetical protein
MNSKFFLFFAFLLFVSTDIFAQHSNQFDDGASHYSTLRGSASGGTYTLPNGGGILLSSSGSTANVWLLGGNTGAGGSNQIGTLDNTDLKFVAGLAGAPNVRMTILGTGAGTGNVSIGAATAPSMLSVGTTNQFQVDGSGNVVKIRNVTYSWPNAQAAAANYVLTNDGAGSLSWAAGGGTGQPKFVLTNVAFGASPYTALTTDQLIHVNTSAGNVVVNLPNANTFSAGQTIVIKNVDPGANGNTVTIQTSNAGIGDNGQNIDDSAPGGWFGNPIGDDQVQRLYSDGVSNWYSW